MIYVSSGVALVAACQGATASDLFDNVPIDSDASVRVDDAAASSSSGSPDLDATTSSSGGSSSGAADAAADVAVSDPDVGGVFCSQAIGYCTGATNACCAARPAGPVLGPYQCKAACVATETSITCDDSDDCGQGEVCCDTNNAAGTPQTIVCKAAASCPYQDTPAGSQSKMCDPNKADTCESYMTGSTCQHQGNMAEGFSICYKQ